MATREKHGDARETRDEPSLSATNQACLRRSKLCLLGGPVRISPTNGRRYGDLYPPAPVCELGHPPLGKGGFAPSRADAPKLSLRTSDRVTGVAIRSLVFELPPSPGLRLTPGDTVRLAVPGKMFARSLAPFFRPLRKLRLRFFCHRQRETAIPPRGEARPRAAHPSPQGRGLPLPRSVPGFRSGEKKPVLRSTLRRTGKLRTTNYELRTTNYERSLTAGGRRRPELCPPRWTRT